MTAARIVRVTGAALEPWLPALAALRIAVFRDYPYLYEGDLAYERRYLAGYAASEAGMIALALADHGEGERVVGAATALPLRQHDDELAPAFAAAGIDPAGVYYFGESVLERAYRGQGIGRAFLREREARARELGCGLAAFCAVVRADEDPRRPADHRPLDALWRSEGFAPRPGLTAAMRWREIGAREETEHAMQFWTKSLEAA